MSSRAADPILQRYRAALGAIYGARVERAVLFGSRARGTARAESDYDIAVFLRDLTDRWREFDRLADLGTMFLDETGAVIHAMPCPADAYHKRTSLMREIRRDGIDL
jgi:predicted nucleotidyltransferase